MPADDPRLVAMDAVPGARDLVPAVIDAVGAAPEGLALADLTARLMQSGASGTAVGAAIEIGCAEGRVEWSHPRRWMGDWNARENPDAWTVSAVSPDRRLAAVAADVRPAQPRHPHASRGEGDEAAQNALYRVVGEDSVGRAWILGYASDMRINVLVHARSLVGEEWSEPVRDETDGIVHIDRVGVDVVFVERRMNDGAWMITDRLVRSGTEGVAYTDVMRQRTIDPGDLTGLA